MQARRLTPCVAACDTSICVQFCWPVSGHVHGTVVEDEQPRAVNCLQDLAPALFTEDQRRFRKRIRFDCCIGDHGGRRDSALRANARTWIDEMVSSLTGVEPVSSRRRRRRDRLVAKPDRADALTRVRMLDASAPAVVVTVATGRGTPPPAFTRKSQHGASTSAARSTARLCRCHRDRSAFRAVTSRCPAPHRSRRCRSHARTGLRSANGRHRL